MPEATHRFKKIGKDYADYLAETRDPIYKPFKERLEYNSFGYKHKHKSYE